MFRVFAVKLLIVVLLFPSVCLSHTGAQETAATKWKGEKISFDFKDLDIKDFFRFIADFSGNNIILDSGVKGTITLKMKDVPWDQVLDLVCKTYGLGYQIEGTAVSVKE
jgi:type II secretory pathway component HofQ